MPLYHCELVSKDPMKLAFIMVIYEYFSDDIKDEVFSLDQCKSWCDNLKSN